MNDRLIRVVLVGAAFVGVVVGIVEAMRPDFLRHFGIGRNVAIGSFFVAIGVAIGALVAQQVSRGITYIRGSRGPFTRRDNGYLFWLHMAFEALIAFAVAAIGVAAILGFLPA